MNQTPQGPRAKEQRRQMHPKRHPGPVAQYTRAKRPSQSSQSRAPSNGTNGPVNQNPPGPRPKEQKRQVYIKAPMPGGPVHPGQKKQELVRQMHRESTSAREVAAPTSQRMEFQANRHPRCTALPIQHTSTCMCKELRITRHRTSLPHPQASTAGGRRNTDFIQYGT